MQQHLEGLRSTASVSETRPAADNTPIIFDLDASYESRPPLLPAMLDGEELLLVTVSMASNGEIALNNNMKPSKAHTENSKILFLIIW